MSQAYLLRNSQLKNNQQLTSKKLVWHENKAVYLHRWKTEVHTNLEKTNLNLTKINLEDKLKDLYFCNPILKQEYGA